VNDKMKEQPKLVTDIWDTILDDRWMWIVVWGVPRCGKTTVALNVAYWVYKDWDKVLQSLVFNLSGLLYKMEKGEPERVWTLNKLHNRIPILLYDDWGGSSNKAITQHDKAWDVFKGSFDLLGTQLAVLMATMVDPNEPTLQLKNKYTHEVWIPIRGIYKYDEVGWQQNFYGWDPMNKKDWLESQAFDTIPRDVYKEYDDMRMSLVPEAFQRIKDAMTENLEWTLKRLQPLDIQLLELIQAKGPVYYKTVTEEMGANAKNALVRCKARNLVIPVRKEKYYRYDLTDLGYEALQALRGKDELGILPKRKEKTLP